jgi:hypothetical protein
MAESSGVSVTQVNSMMAALRSEVRGEINQIRNELRLQIERLEREMIEVGEMIVREIGKQTAHLSGDITTQTTAVVGGVALTTVMVERTKGQIEEDFSRTRKTLDLQTQATLEIEMGKKLADCVSTHGKLAAFSADVMNRYQKSLELTFQNRQLYNVNFDKIYQEYNNKIRTIGEHIFSIRENDILPAREAANSSHEAIHSFPMEIDLERLKVRADRLEDSLAVLRDNRLDQIVNSLDYLSEHLKDHFSADIPTGYSDGSRFQVVVMGLKSSLSNEYLLGATVADGDNNGIFRLNHNDASFLEYRSSDVKAKVDALFESKGRPATEEEIERLLHAVARLEEKDGLTEPVARLVSDFLRSGNLAFGG